MIPQHSRRQFLRTTAAVGLAATLPQLTPAAPAEQGGAFSFGLFGDIHFDRLAHHDMPWLAKEHPGDVSQVQNYSRLTTEIVPGLMGEMRDAVAAAPAPVPFVVQIGDVVEGLCGNSALAKTQCDEAVQLVKGATLGAPMLITKGNHDITGPGAKEAFDGVLMPFQRDAVGPAGIEMKQLAGACYAVERGDALVAFYDSYDRASLPWLEKLLEKRSARHLLVMIHQPVIPYAARLWHVFDKPQQQEQRNRLVNLLGRHKAIVFNGHLHKYGLLARKTDGDGRIVQLSVSSVIPSATFQAKDVTEGADKYGPDVVELEPHFQPDTKPQRREVLKAEAPMIEHYEYADAPGYAVVHVTPETVAADVYLGLGKRLWRRVDLTKLLRGG